MAARKIPRLENGSIFQIIGPTGSGKTYFTCQVLDAENLFRKPHRQIYWHTGNNEGEAGATLRRFKRLKQLHLVHGLPKGWIDQPKKFDVIVIDDLFEEANQDVTFNQLFTKIARHRQVTVFFLTQNSFNQDSKHRIRNVNTRYLVIFKNPCDNTAIDYIAQQAFPNNRKYLKNAFHHATNNKPHGYLFIDCTQQCPENLRVRTNIFNFRQGPTTYTPLNDTKISDRSIQQRSNSSEECLSSVHQLVSAVGRASGHDLRRRCSGCYKRKMEEVADHQVPNREVKKVRTYCPACEKSFCNECFIHEECHSIL